MTLFIADTPSFSLRTPKMIYTIIYIVTKPTMCIHMVYSTQVTVHINAADIGVYKITHTTTRKLVSKQDLVSPLMQKFRTFIRLCAMAFIEVFVDKFSSKQ